LVVETPEDAIAVRFGFNAILIRPDELVIRNPPFAEIKFRFVPRATLTVLLQIANAPLVALTVTDPPIDVFPSGKICPNSSVGARRKRESRVLIDR
jgi:hypothetical protein